MRISIIIPAYNEGNVIQFTLRHLFRYGGSQLKEIIVVDGSSQDETADLARTEGAEVCVAPQRGRAAQMDHGALKASGDILYFVHADTLPPIGFAQDIVHAVNHGSKMGNFRYRFTEGPWLLHINAYTTRYRWFFTQGGDRTFFIRQEDYHALGGYDRNLIIMEEYEFLRRAKRRGYDLTLIPKECLVSSRKYDRNSWLRVQMVNLAIYGAWSMGLASNQQLRNWYTRWLH